MCEINSETLFVEEVKEMQSGSGRPESARTARDGSGRLGTARDGSGRLGMARDALGMARVGIGTLGTGRGRWGGV